MELSILTIKLLFIFFPGIIASGIFYKLTTHKDYSTTEYIVSGFIYGVVSYLILDLFIKVDFIECIFDKNESINSNQIIYASLIGVTIGIIMVVFKTYELTYRLARFFKITKTFSEDNVWSHVLNCPDIYQSWVLVRDSNEDKMYEGWIEYYSDDISGNELFLRDVKVYVNSTAAELYYLDGMYISRNTDNITIEFREIINSKPDKPKYKKNKFKKEGNDDKKF